MRINIVCTGRYCTVIEITEYGAVSVISTIVQYLTGRIVQGGSNMTGTDLYVNKPHCAAAV